MVCEHKKDRSVIRIVTYHANYSAFSGYRKTASDYSELECKVCGHLWRSKADYVEEIAGRDRASIQASKERKANPVPYIPAPRRPPCACACHKKQDAMSTNPMFGKMKRIDCSWDSASSPTLCGACGKAFPGVA